MQQNIQFVFENTSVRYVQGLESADSVLEDHGKHISHCVQFG